MFGPLTGRRWQVLVALQLKSVKDFGRLHSRSEFGLALTSFLFVGGSLAMNPVGGSTRLILSMFIAWGFFSRCLCARNWERFQANQALSLSFLFL